jgi:purine-nucleoside/S-methyl-5'-thioadenosine phosphorylase / adenosine deaminase
MDETVPPMTEASAFRAVPGLVHGFERRLSAARLETREEARERLRRSLHDAGQVLFLKQVHGARVVEAPWPGTPEADAATASEPGWILGVETADCLPLLLVDPERRAVAAVHAGWRGTAAGVAMRAVEALRTAGSRPEHLLAALGPAIGPCCYEVGEELEAVFGPRGSGFFRPGPRGRPHLDVRAANHRQLVESGLRPDRIQDVDECTYCRDDLYHSYRRSGPDAGRMLSFVGFAAGA